MNADDLSRTLGIALETLSECARNNCDAVELRRRLVNIAASLVNAPRASLWLVDGDKQHLRLAASFGLPEGMLEAKVLYRPGDRLAGRVWAREKTLIIDSDEELRAQRGEIGEPDIFLGDLSRLQSLYALPVLTESSVIGVLTVERDKPAAPFRALEMEALDALVKRFEIVSKIGPLSEESEFVVEIDIPPGPSDDDVVAAVGHLSVLVDDLHRALGGRGLKVSGMEVFEKASIPEGVPSG